MEGFPFVTGGQISAPILLTQLHQPSRPNSLHLVALSFDGYLYVVDAHSGEPPLSEVTAVCLEPCQTV